MTADVAADDAAADELIFENEKEEVKEEEVT